MQLHSLPEWTKSVFPSDDLDEVALVMYYIYSYTPDLARYFSGFVLKDIFDRSASKAAGTLSPDRNVWIYSSHDDVVASLLYALGLYDVIYIYQFLKVITLPLPLWYFADDLCSIRCLCLI